MPAFRPWGGGGEGGKLFIRILELFGKTDGGSRTQRESVQCSFSQAKPGQGSSNLSERRRRAAVGRRAAAASDDNGSGGSGEQQQPTATTWQMFVLSSQACLAASVEAWHVSLLEVQ